VNVLSHKPALTKGALVTAAVAALAFTAGCSSLPPVDETRTVHLQTDFTGMSKLQVDVDGDPELRPGAMAAEGMYGSVEACNIFFWACAIFMVPTAAATGAIITAIETLPEEDALALNHVTANVVSRTGVNLDIAFDAAMRREAERHGIELKSVFADVSLQAYISGVRWNVGVGNHVAIETTFTIHGHSDGKSGRRDIKVVSDSAKVEEWVAGAGERIEEALIVMVDEASIEIWERILDHDCGRLLRPPGSQ
jgi:hypothetical protein